MESLSNEHFLRILSSREFEAVDIILAETLEVEYSETNRWIQLAAAMASMLVRNGHAYLDLSTPEHYLRLNHSIPITWPNQDDWQSLLQQSPTCTPDDDFLPLVLNSNNRLYLHRYYHHEQSIARAILSLCENEAVNQETKLPPELLKGLHENQIEGILGALKNSFFIITGGPGTGKTTTVLRFLIARLSQSTRPEFLRIGIAAPTGKAAARLSESITAGIESAQAPQAIKEILKSVPCQTIHRMLGSLPGLSTFRHNKTNTLPYDILVVDEASMIDLPLMRHFLDALPDTANLLLLGDADQLSSVNVGSVFRDLLDASKSSTSPLTNNVCQLTKTHRFDESSGIFYLCNAIRSNQQSAIIETIENNPFEDLSINLGTNEKANQRAIVKSGVSHWQEIIASNRIEDALPKLTDHIILSTLRQGKHGTESLNQSISQAIRKKHEPQSTQDLFHGMPIIVMENNYDTELYNGDLGLIWSEDNALKAYFPDTEGNPRVFPISSLPRHEAAFALTIHKSQGSEFSHVSVFLSESHENSLSKELIYTAFSRARHKLTITGDPLALLKGISTQVNRATGLADRLQLQTETINRKQ